MGFDTVITTGKESVTGARQVAGSVISEFRARRGIKQQAFANHLGITVRRLRKITNSPGYVSISVSTQNKIRKNYPDLARLLSLPNETRSLDCEFIAALPELIRNDLTINLRQLDICDARQQRRQLVRMTERYSFPGSLFETFDHVPELASHFRSGMTNPKELKLLMNGPKAIRIAVSCILYATVAVLRNILRKEYHIEIDDWYTSTAEVADAVVKGEQEPDLIVLTAPVFSHFSQTAAFKEYQLFQVWYPLEHRILRSSGLDIPLDSAIDRFHFIDDERASSHATYQELRKEGLVSSDSPGHLAAQEALRFLHDGNESSNLILPAPLSNTARMLGLATPAAAHVIDPRVQEIVLVAHKRLMDARDRKCDSIGNAIVRSWYELLFFETVRNQMVDSMVADPDYVYNVSAASGLHRLLTD